MGEKNPNGHRGDVAAAILFGHRVFDFRADASITRFKFS